MLTIIDYGIGNLSSIKNMLRHIGISAQITSDIAAIAQAEKLILPGVGHFNYGMEQLHKSGLVSVLNKRVLEDKVPILGICLGAQLLTKSSEEGSAPGLGWIDGKTIAFNKDKLTSIQKIPHMGWSNVSNYQQSKLFTNIPTEPVDCETICPNSCISLRLKIISTGSPGLSVHPLLSNLSQLTRTTLKALFTIGIVDL